MLQKALRGSLGYYAWLTFLLLIIFTVSFHYHEQSRYGLGLTGMGRSVSWGLYIGQWTFLAGIAASVVMVVLPCYVHNYRMLGRIAVLGQFLAVASTIMSMLFVMVDLGKPERALNMVLHPHPLSPFFWDMVFLTGFLVLNGVIGWAMLAAEARRVAPPRWLISLIYLSLPWAVCMHTITAFVFAGLPGRPFWLTALMAPRFLASACASGLAFLTIVCVQLKERSLFDPGEMAVQTLAKIIAYAMVAVIFFFLCELFTVYYSQVPDTMYHYAYMFWGLEGHAELTPLMRCAVVLAVVAAILFISPRTRSNLTTLQIGCAAAFGSLWMEKGLVVVVTGFVPSTLEFVVQYLPTVPELSISLGVWALGLIVLTVLFKVALEVWREHDA